MIVTDECVLTNRSKDKSATLLLAVIKMMRTSKF